MGIPLPQCEKERAVLESNSIPQDSTHYLQLTPDSNPWMPVESTLAGRDTSDEGVGVCAILCILLELRCVLVLANKRLCESMGCGANRSSALISTRIHDVPKATVHQVEIQVCWATSEVAASLGGGTFMRSQQGESLPRTE